MTTIARKPAADWLTVAAIAAIAISLNVAFHEGVHALTCLITGGDLQIYSALAVLCETTTATQEKVTAGSASIANLIAGMIIWLYLRRSRSHPPARQYFLWLFMLMNWLYGAGYWLFSGVANIGDWAVVIDGWEPAVVWRIIMSIIGGLTFMLAVWLALRLFGQLIGGEPGEQIGRANRLAIISYVTAGVVVILAGLFFPEGLISLPATAGIIAVLGALSPLLWMMQWFRAGMFSKVAKEALVIERQTGIIAIAIIVVIVYAFILGRGLYL